MPACAVEHHHLVFLQETSSWTAELTTRNSFRSNPFANRGLLDIVERHVLTKLAARDVGRLATTSRAFAALISACPDERWGHMARAELLLQFPVNLAGDSSATCKEALQAAHQSAQNLARGKSPRKIQILLDDVPPTGFMYSPDGVLPAYFSSQKIEVRSDTSAATCNPDAYTVGFHSLQWCSAALSAAQGLSKGWHLAMATYENSVCILQIQEVQNQLTIECITQHQCGCWDTGNSWSPDRGVLAFWTLKDDWQWHTQEWSSHIRFSYFMRPKSAFFAFSIA